MTAPAHAPPLSVVVVIAQYPPFSRGGYELRCRDVCRGLVRRGHRVTVVTSREGRKGIDDDEGVRVVRELHLWPQGVSGPAAIPGFVTATASDCHRLRRETRRSRADVVTYWHQSGLTSALLAVRPRRGCGVLCDVSSDWLHDAAGTGGNWFRVWERRSSSRGRAMVRGVLRGFAALLGAPVRRPPFPPGRVYFTSAEMKKDHVEAGICGSDAAQIRSGVDLSLFPFAAERRSGARTVLFLSRIKRWKGLHTSVLAMGYLPENVVLRVAGYIDDSSYLAEVAELAKASRVLGRVRICDPVPHAEVPSLLRDAHVLVFGSEQPEPFSRLVLEAFASGTPVVGTTIGGTGEVLIEGETGLTYPPGNARALADQIARLFSDHALRERLVANARRLVETRYSLDWTVDQIEALLRQAHADASAPAG